MKRRVVLAGAGLALSTLGSGCQSEPGTTDTGETTTAAESENGTGTATADGETSTSHSGTDTTAGADTAEKIMIVLRNRTPTEQLVHVTLSTEDDTLIDAEFTIASDARHAIDSGITEIGQYDVAITVEEGPATSITFDVSEYDLGMGSNLIAEIFEDEIRILIEQ